ncbi:MAG TPA: glycosyltransferase [Thermoanaerobaculia bacterium]|nr:glycosyltransferase [Thermoanaerobaculia bacterium]
MPRIAIIVPCYNEARRLKLEAFRRYFGGHDNGVAFLFVNDGSGDDTADVLRSFAAELPDRIEILDLQPNRGKAEAVRLGFLQAFQRDPDLVGFWDADLAAPLSEIDPFLEIFSSIPGVETVFGSRVKLMGHAIERHAARHYIGRISATAISMTLGLAVYDTQCGAKLFRNTEKLREVFADPFVTRWIFDVEIIARLIRASSLEHVQETLYELPLREWRDVAGSKVKPYDFIRSASDLWRIHRTYLRDGKD